MNRLLGRAAGASHELVREVLRPGSIAVDATAGAGHDTLFLAQTVGPSGQVYAFDVQQTALEETRLLLEHAGLTGFTHLLPTGHEHIKEALPPEIYGRLDAVMYNLGWLPGSDKRVVTQAQTTTASLKAACELLAPGGIITIVLYAHEAGKIEAKAVEQFCSQLTGSLSAFSLHRLNRSGAPYMIAITKQENGDK